MKRSGHSIIHGLPTRTDAFLESVGTKAVLSALILLSVLPVALHSAVRPVLFGVFSAELALRGWLLIGRWGMLAPRQRPGLIAVLALDILATASFAPGVWESASGGELRLLRLIRMALLVTYWGSYLRDFFAIALRQERLQQLGLVAVFAALLTGTGAATINLLDVRGLDTDEDGVVDEPEDHELASVLWWCLRQVQDPGNLVTSSADGRLAGLSLALTAGGLLLMALLIGQGANLVTEMVSASRRRPIPFLRHVVVLHATRQTLGVLVEMGQYYRKQLRRVRFAVLCDAEQRPAFLDTPATRSFRFVPGLATDEESLRRAAIPTARRVVVLSPGPGLHGDAAAMTAALAAHALAPEATIAVELNAESSVVLARRVDRVRLMPVRARHIAAGILARVALEPESAPVFTELLSCEGHELYSVVLGEGDAAELPPTVDVQVSFSTLVRRLYAEFGVIVAGVLRPAAGLHVTVELAPPGARVGTIRGLVGVADRFGSLLRGVVGLVAHPPRQEMPPPPALPEGSLRSRPRVNRVLVHGAPDMLEDLLEAWALTFDGPASAVVVVRDEVRAALVRQRWAQRQSALAATVATASRLRPIHIEARVGDRLSPEMLDQARTEGFDRWVLLPDDTSDPDAATVLALLHAEMGPEGGPIVIADLAHPDKVALWTQRLERLPVHRRPYLLATEKLREQMLAQTFFVRALPDIYRALLGPRGGRVRVLPPGLQTTFEDALAATSAAGLVLVAASGSRGALTVGPGARTGAGDRVYLLGDTWAEREHQGESA